MTHPNPRWLRRSLLVLAFLSVAAHGRCPGLDPVAYLELEAAGVNKYVGEFSPETSEEAGNGWTKHTFDTEGGEGPTCIDGSEFTVFTRPGTNPRKTLLFLDGGGACWQDFYFCSVTADQDAPPDVGIFAASFDTGAEVIENPLADYNIVAASYCDGSVWAGDNTVVDPNFPFGGVRNHRGLRNVTAAMDLARDEFGWARKLFLSGASAGGVGASAFAPSLARFIYGNQTQIKVFNDAGPVAINNLPIPPILAVLQQREDDWQFSQFYPESCTECSPFNQATELIKWRLGRDSRLAESFYSTDGDSTNRFFLAIPDQITYRAVITSVHGEVNALFPDTYKTFIRSGDDSHTALGTPLFYLGTADGVPLYQWTADFVRNRAGWINIVEDFVPVPAP